MTTTQLIASAEREVSMRRRVYPRRVADRKMSQREADHEIECMEQIAATLKRLAYEQQQDLFNQQQQ